MEYIIIGTVEIKDDIRSVFNEFVYILKRLKDYNINKRIWIQFHDHNEHNVMTLSLLINPLGPFTMMHNKVFTGLDTKVAIFIKYEEKENGTNARIDDRKSVAQ